MYYEGNRILLTESIMAGRKAQREKEYVVSRGAWDYLQDFHGLKALFDYVRAHGQKLGNEVLDLGAGITRAAAELSGHDAFGRRLVFRGISLLYDPEIEKYLGRKFTRIGAIETTEAFSPNSLAAVISHYGLAYAAEPNLAIEKINLILRPGGILKSIFPRSEMKIQETVARTADAFRQRLQELGFDLYEPNRNLTPYHSILIAVKPGGESGLSASDLFWTDNQTYEQQLKELRRFKNSEPHLPETFSGTVANPVGTMGISADLEGK